MVSVMSVHMLWCGQACNVCWNCGQLTTPLTTQRLHLTTHDHFLAIKNPLKYRDLWQKISYKLGVTVWLSKTDSQSPTTRLIVATIQFELLVWRYGFWISVHAGLWSRQSCCHHINYEQNWSSLTHISIFGCKVVFFGAFLGRGTTFNGFVEVEGRQTTQNGCHLQLQHIPNYVRWGLGVIGHDLHEQRRQSKIGTK